MAREGLTERRPSAGWQDFPHRLSDFSYIHQTKSGVPPDGERRKLPSGVKG